MAEATDEHPRLEAERATAVRRREGRPTQEADGPTEEIELETAEVAATAAAPSLPRKTSVPPPPPPAALRVRPAVAPGPAGLKSSTPPPLDAARARALGSPPPVGAGVRPPMLPRAPKLAAATPEADQLKQELERITKRMRERDAYLAELEAVYAQREAALIKAEEQIEELRKQLTEQRERIEELERARRPATTPPPAAEDDLTRIRGIGPRYARQLQVSGIRTFAEIAAWTPADVLAISRELKVTPSRIERDEWVEQARVLVKLLTPPRPEG